jgi:dienelactone hydrolase
MNLVERHPILAKLTFAETDHTFPTESRRRAEDILVEKKATYHIQVFSSVVHGFATRGDPTVDHIRAHLFYS